MMQQLTPEALAKAREWFAANCEAQIAAIKESLKTPEVFYCNDPHYRIARLEAEAEEWRTGEVRMTFALWQRAYQYQTGECVGLLP